MYWDQTGEWRLSYYSKLEDKDESKLTKIEKNERNLDRLEKRLTRKLLANSSINKMLDIGCGVGRQILEFSKEYPTKTFVGIDKSNYQIELLGSLITKNRINNVVGVAMDAAQIFNFKERFDIVTFFNNSLGCMDFDQQISCLNSLAHILTCGGYILISCFDCMELIEEAYLEWKLPPVNIDYSTGIVDLGEYKSNWKCKDIIFSCFEKYSEIQIQLEEHIGLGTVYVFQKK